MPASPLGAEGRRNYKRPPITEAVIELRFETPLPIDLLNKVHGRLKTDYAFSDPFEGLNLAINPDRREAQFTVEHSGHRLSSEDRADVLLISTLSITCSRLAPYLSWEPFRARAEDNWNTFKQSVGYRKIIRLGVRYINRIDIPVAKGHGVKPEEYLRCYPEVPEFSSPLELSSYTMQVTGPIGSDDCTLMVNTSLVPSPLVNHISIILDVDISRTGNVPQRDEELWALVDAIRGHKNRIFEACIKDKARELFDT